MQGKCRGFRGFYVPQLLMQFFVFRGQWYAYCIPWPLMRKLFSAVNDSKSVFRSQWFFVQGTES